MTKAAINNGGYRKKRPLTKLITLVQRKIASQPGGKRGGLRQFPWRRISLLLLLASSVGLLLPAQALGISLLVLLLLAILFEFATANIRKFSPNDKDLLFLTLLLVALLFVTKVSLVVFPFVGQALPEIPDSAYVYAIGIAGGAMLVRILLNSETTLVFSFVVSLFASWLMEENLFFFLYFFWHSWVIA